MTNRGQNKGSGDLERLQNEKIWQLLENIPQPSDDLENRIISRSLGTHSSENIQKASYYWIFRVAAALLVIIGAGIWYYYGSVDDVTDITSAAYEPVHYQAQRGETIEVNLTDEIYIQLNAETELRVLSGTDETLPRLVYLLGEAYFNVSQAPEGFEVITEAGLVQVLGTAFNIRTRDEEVEVAVESGLVALRGLPEEDSDTVVQVPAGHRSAKQRNTPALDPSPVDIDRYLSWRKGMFVFEQTPLNDVILNLERAYNVRIDLHDRNLQTIRVTGEFGQEPLARILNEICWSANLRFRQEDDKYILYQPE